MCLYPGLCELKIILVHEIIAVIWALVIQKQECFHRWEEMDWPRICLVTLGVHVWRKAEGVSVDLWTLTAVTYVNQDSCLLQQPEAVGTLFFIHILSSPNRLPNCIHGPPFPYTLHSFMDVRQG